MQHPCTTGGATKLFCNMALPCPIPFRLQMVVWGPGSCIFVFFLQGSWWFLWSSSFGKHRLWEEHGPSYCDCRGGGCVSPPPVPRSAWRPWLLCGEQQRNACLQSSQRHKKKDLKQSELWGEINQAWVCFFLCFNFFFWRWNMEKKSRYPLKPQKIQMEEGIAWGSQCIYWVGQKACSGFSVRSYGKTWMNLLANPIHAFSSPSGTRVIVFMNWNLISPFPRGL